MTRLHATAGAVLAGFVLSAALDAQWPAYPPATAGVPRAADGKPDLRAPTPRTADGTPDLTGVWQNEWVLKLGGRTPDLPNPPEADPPPLATFFDVGAGFKGGLPFRPWAAELMKQRKAANSKDNPDAYCLPMGLLQFHEHPQPRKIVQTPNLILILYEANYGLRQIFMDGRSLPDTDSQPWWYGYSIGRWEGDTLVVETTGFRDGDWLDIWGSPMTDAAKLTERFHRVNYGTLRIDVTIDDPRAYTRPFTVRFNQYLAPEMELIEFICVENEKSTAHFEK
jgi:hypothetical protein